MSPQIFIFNKELSFMTPDDLNILCACVCLGCFKSANFHLCCDGLLFVGYLYLTKN